MSKIEKDISKIIGIQFSILSPEEIEKGSVAEIVNRDTYVNNKPVLGGLFDPRMGILDPGLICPTDGLDYIQTPGYFGHIRLSRPVFYIQYLSTVIKILRCICIKCSKLLIDKESEICKVIAKQPPKLRWMEVYNLCSKVKVCGQETIDGCGCKQPDSYKVDGVTGVKATIKGDEGEETIKISYEAEYIKQIFEKITDEDSNFMGFSEAWCRPEWLICSALPVPPPAVRPSVKQDNSQRMDDDLTHKLADIIRYNESLKMKINKGVKPEIIQDWTNMLQYHVATLINNDQPLLMANSDQFIEWDDTERRHRVYGDYPNASSIVRVEVDPDVKEGLLSNPRLLPFGSYGPIRQKTWSWQSGTSEPTDRWVNGIGDIGLPYDANVTFLATGIGAGQAYDFTGSLVYPTINLRVSASDGNISDPLDAYFGIDTTQAGSNRFEDSYLDLVRVLPNAVNGFTVVDSTEYSYIFTLDDLSSSRSSLETCIFSGVFLALLDGNIGVPLLEISPLYKSAKLSPISSSSSNPSSTCSMCFLNL